MNTSVFAKVNTNQSIIGQDIIDWIAADKDSKTEEEITICRKLYHKYIVDREGNPKTKIYPDVFYYVNYNNKFNPNIYMAYIVRDKSKSPRKIPENLQNLDLANSKDSFRGNLIQEWAYFQNSSSENQFYMDGNDIVTNYFENNHPLRLSAYYFVSHTTKGIKIFRDTDKSPYPTDDEPIKDDFV